MALNIDLNAPGIQYLAAGNSAQDISEFQLTLNLGMFPGGLPSNPLIGVIAQKAATPSQEDTFDVEYPGVLKSYPFDKDVGVPRSQRQTLQFYKRITNYKHTVCPLIVDMLLSTQNIMRQTSSALGSAIENYQFEMTEHFMTAITGVMHEKLSRGLWIDAEPKVDQPKTMAQDNVYVWTMPEEPRSGTEPRTGDLTYEEWEEMAQVVSPQSTLVTDELGGMDCILMAEQDWAKLRFLAKTYGPDNTPRNASMQGLFADRPSIELGGRFWAIAKYGERHLADRVNALMSTPFITADAANPGFSFRYIPFIKRNACIMSPTIVNMPNWVPENTEKFTWFVSQLLSRFGALRIGGGTAGAPGGGLGFIRKRFKDTNPDIPKPVKVVIVDPTPAKQMSGVVPNIT